MKASPAYYRARIAVLKRWLEELPNSSEIVVDNDLRLLRGGFIPDYHAGEFEKDVQKTLEKNGFSDAPLSFTELTGFNTWFAKYPEKVAGVEYASTSIHFPIMIKGSKQQVAETIRAGMKQEPAKNPLQRNRPQKKEQKHYWKNY